MRVAVVDPSAYTPAYDHALCSALARAGAAVELLTGPFDYAAPPAPEGYSRRELFYRWTPGAPGSRARLAAKLVQHVPGMVALRKFADAADVVHFQWLAAQALDAALLPSGAPKVLTAHDVLPREPRPGALAGQRRLYERVDAIVVHYEHGRERLFRTLGVDPERVHVIPHGAFEHMTRLPDERPLPPDLAAVEVPVVLFFGLLRPYKGIDVLLDAWQGVRDAELWIVGRPRFDVEPLRRRSPPSVRWVARYVDDAEVPAYFRRADLAVLPYREIDQSGVLYTALAFGVPLVLSDVGGFPEVAATGAGELVPPGDPAALRATLDRLLDDHDRRAELAVAARRAARETYSWDRAAQLTLELYRSLRR